LASGLRSGLDFILGGDGSGRLKQAGKNASRELRIFLPSTCGHGWHVVLSENRFSLFLNLIKLPFGNHPVRSGAMVMTRLRLTPFLTATIHIQ
jgi:hypothetical protein